MRKRRTAKPLVDNPDPCPLRNQEWKTIAEPVRLQGEAKQAMEWAVGMYRFRSQFEGRRPSQVKAKLRGLIARADALLTCLNGSKWDVFSALTDDISTVNDVGKFGQTPRLDAYRLLEQKFAELDGLRRLLALAQDKVARATPGPSAAAANLQILVRDLSGILENYSTYQFQRSRPVVAFVEAVCHVANSKIGSGSIDEAMKRVVRMCKNGSAQSHHGGVGAKEN
jgi:hypothetical protein